MIEEFRGTFDINIECVFAIVFLKTEILLT